MPTITAVEITRRRTSSTSKADNVADFDGAEGRGRFSYLKVRLGDARGHTHVGYVEELADCVRLFDANWNHVGTATSITDAIAVAALQSDRFTTPDELPTIVLRNPRRKAP